ncbi:hypothetical protein [Streptomyces sp. NEAU-S7GS2]|uniref:hypothetical protein n=1 Tax=Streptomyces sp. NEAU-S7GS2 TaxID=2202000 RepID=UPI0013A5592F|nr:hypothetical protein [Streptomyces sp. NEAU-S7GS2]
MNDLTAPQRLAHELRELRKRAGNPSYTVIAVWGGQQEPPVRLGKSKLSLWFSGKSVRQINTARTEDAAKARFAQFEEVWGGQYPAMTGL